LFETLIRDNKQIIITSDRYPRALEGIQERLRSRFESGISIEIEPPELEMRVGILLKKAAYENIKLSEDVAFYIAKLLRANVRELEGALRKVIAYSRFHKQDITVDMTKIALKDLLASTQAYISIESIQKVVADFYKIKIIDMFSKKRPKSIAFPRQVAMYLSKELTSKSLPDIGEHFGGRDHTTVLHAHRKIMEDKRQNQQLSHELHLLEQLLKG
jgi:chromosomal replication initiator protein